MIVFRHSARGIPFFWEAPEQPAARWHRKGEGPVQYVANTPDGAWAEFLRHEGITEEIDLDGIKRTLWAIDIAEEALAVPRLPETTLHGGQDSYEDCQNEAASLRTAGHTGLSTTSAALMSGAAGGWQTREGLRPGPESDGQVYVLFGSRPEAVAWKIVDEGCPPAEILAVVRHLEI